MGLGIFPHKEIRELAPLRWFWHVVRMGDGSYPKVAWQARVQRKRPKGSLRYTRGEGTQKIFKERWAEWKGVIALTRDRERLKDLCKPSTPTGRIVATKRSEVSFSIHPHLKRSDHVSFIIPINITQALRAATRYVYIYKVSDMKRVCIRHEEL